MGITKAQRDKQAKAVPLEEDEQIDLFHWAWKRPGWEEIFDCVPPPELQYLHAIPNGGYRTKPEAHRLKLQGVKPGVHDCFLPVPRHGMHGMYLEMKRLKGSKTSDEQIQWYEDMTLFGYRCAIVKGHQEAIHALMDYLVPDWDLPF